MKYISSTKCRHYIKYSLHLLRKYTIMCILLVSSCTVMNCICSSYEPHSAHTHSIAVCAFYTKCTWLLSYISIICKCFPLAEFEMSVTIKKKNCASFTVADVQNNLWRTINVQTVAISYVRTAGSGQCSLNHCIMLSNPPQHTPQRITHHHHQS